MYSLNIETNWSTTATHSGYFHISREQNRAKQLVPGGSVQLQMPSCTGPSAYTFAVTAPATSTYEQESGSGGPGVSAAAVGCMVAVGVLLAAAAFRSRHRRGRPQSTTMPTEAAAASSDELATTEAGGVTGIRTRASNRYAAL